MKKNSIIILIIVLIIIGGVWAITSSSKKSSASVNASSVATDSNKPQLFSSLPLSKSAYLISGPTIDANTKTALTGFNMTKKVLADGSTEITLNSTNPEYKNQIYTVKPGQKLYFIETVLGDDSNNEDRNLGDDTAVLVDANGYIVQ